MPTSSRTIKPDAQCLAAADLALEVAQEAAGAMGVPGDEAAKRVPVQGSNYDLGHGDVVIAAITSCTNTSNPYVMVAAGLVARKAVAKGLTAKPWVKTSLAPGSRVITTAGIHATVRSVDQGEVVLEIAPDVLVRFADAAVVRVLDPSAGPGDGEPGQPAA